MNHCCISVSAGCHCNFRKIDSGSLKVLCGNYMNERQCWPRKSPSKSVFRDKLEIQGILLEYYAPGTPIAS